MAMRCFGRARLAAGTVRAFDFNFLRAEDLAAVLVAVLPALLLAIFPAVLRTGDFFCAAPRLAAREVGFFLAMDELPFRYEQRVAHLKARRTQRERAFADSFEFDRIAQCSRNMPSTARNSAGLISLEWATVTANRGPSSFCCQNDRKSFSAGKLGTRTYFF